MELTRYSYTIFSNNGDGQILASLLCESDKQFEDRLKSAFQISAINIAVETENPASTYARPGLGMLFTKFRENPDVKFQGCDTLLLHEGRSVKFERLKGTTTTLHLHQFGRHVKSFENAEQVYNYLS